MHDMLEGVCVYDTSKILLSLIESKVITIDLLNNRKNLFPYGELEVGNVSKVLSKKNLQSCNLKMTASEMLCFIRYLPLMLGDIVPKENIFWKSLLNLISVLDFLMKDEYSENDLIYLAKLIKEHHETYARLFGHLKPKHHFMVHYPKAIRMGGPLKYLWSMRFEAKHKDTKIYFNSITSRLNPSKSIARKSCFQFSYFLLKYSLGVPKEFEENYFQNHNPDLLKIFESNEFGIDIKSAKTSYEITYKCSIYKQKYYIGILCKDFKLYKINFFLLVNDKIFIACNEIAIKGFDKHFVAYEVGECVNENIVTPIDNFSTRPMHLYTIANGKCCRQIANFTKFTTLKY
ncbi:PREDICTED: uncharacterized protein LOC108361596 isoform X1 [Rhagoletis zephyria]|uniref:uncharacterized protein LOC108361596 isoform X1 n=1 Tax=Rhagoletis zephyria TaxID=28612 RepID=UPI00081190DA|nr:PREDICTED: uncharacterized protein LOC108361596 isoform X1 [Rhagoletis zephyria]